MRRILMTAILFPLLSSAALADTITAKVNGMVCAFCATGIEESFKKQPAVDTVKVDLDKQLVTIHTRPGKTLDDKTVKKVVTDAGYVCIKVDHAKADTDKKADANQKNHEP
jgi:mercuric ion binding protein